MAEVINFKVERIGGGKYQIEIVGTLRRQTVDGLEKVKKLIVNKIDEWESEEADSRGMG